MPCVKVEPNVKLVASDATVTVMLPFASTRPEALRPLTVPDTDISAGVELLLPLQAARMRRDAVTRSRESCFCIMRL